MAVGGHVGRGVVQAAHREVLVADPDVPVEAGQAGEGTQQLLLAVAHDTGDPDDLAAVGGEGDVGEVVPRETTDRQHRLLTLWGKVFGREGVLQLPAHDHGQQLVVGDVGDEDGPAVAAVPEDRHAIGQFPDLREAVGDVDDRRARTRGGSDPLEEQLDRVLAEGGRRLVEDEKFRVQGERLGQLQEVLLRDAHAADAVLEVGGGTDVVEQRTHGRRLVPGEVQELLRHGDSDVLGHRQVGQHGGVLVDDGDAQPAGRRRIESGHGLAVDLDRAGVRLGGARGHPHERGLAGAVLAQERVDLSRQELDRHVGQGGHGAVGLGDAGQGHRRPHQPRRLLRLLCHHVVLRVEREWVERE